MTDVFCDYFQLSFPIDEGQALLNRFLAYDDGLLLKQEKQDTLRGGVNALYKSQNSTGSIKVTSIGKVVTMGVSGGILGELRDTGALPGFLHNLTTDGVRSVGHVVTRLDATLDVHTDVNGYIKRLYDRIRLTGVKLTRKRIPPESFKLRLGRSHVDPLHEDTGTIYLEKRNTSTAKITIYDKSNQMSEVYGRTIPPTIRYEMMFSREIGMNCKDICLPAPLFWHHMDPCLLEKPPDVVPWGSYPSEYVLATKPPRVPLPLERFEGLNLVKVISKDVSKGYYTPQDAANALLYLITKQTSERSK